MPIKLGVKTYSPNDLIFIKRLARYCGDKYKNLSDVFCTAVLDWLNNHTAKYPHTEISIITEEKIWRKLKGKDAKLDFLDNYVKMLERFKAYIDDGQPTKAEYEYVYWFNNCMYEHRCYYRGAEY